MKDLMITNKHHGIITSRNVNKRNIITDICYDMLDAGIINNVLVVAPLQLLKLDWMDVNSYQHEFIHGWDKLRILKNSNRVKFINPEGLLWLVDNKSNIDKRTMLIIDMPSVFINTRSKQTQYMHNLLDSFCRRILITSRFITHDLLDIYSQAFLLDLGETFGTDFYKFRGKYFHKVDSRSWSQWVPNKNIDLLSNVYDMISVIKYDIMANEFVLGDL